VTLPVGPDTRVTLHFSLLLPGGEEIDSTRRGRPATFAVGDGSLPPGFERALFGLTAGADEQLHIAAADAFGDAREDNLRLIPRVQFDRNMILEPGVVVSFASTGGELAGVVRSLQGELVVVDFNHPLAGRDLIFDVTILRVEAS
jgi:FKBP-type peptidyl-prolyl cis-trans isomerase SlpA